MRKSKLMNKRNNSLAKPILYLVLQIIGVIELISLLNGSFNIFSWNIIEQAILFLVSIYFISRTYKIIHRTDEMNSSWYHKIEMEKFINR